MFPTEPVPEKLGAYKVIRRLSRAGGADVYLGRMEGPMGFQRLCALKLVANSIEGDARLAEELAREAAICARLNHPAIVRMFDFFEHERRLVLVLEYVDGAGLDRLVQHLGRRRQRLPDSAVWYLGRQLAGALAHAHAARDDAGHATPVLHRNLSPESVLVSWDGQVRLSGFGLGKIVGRTPDTVVGAVKGAPGYMPPEQARGERLSPRADVYALGVLLWCLLTGSDPPASGARPEPLSTLRTDLPRELVAAIEASMEPAHDKRKITCAEIEQWLSKVAKVDAGRAELCDKILLLRSARGEPGAHENARPMSGGVEPRRRVSLRTVRAAQRPAKPRSVAPPRRSTRPPVGLGHAARALQPTLLGLAAPRAATFPAPPIIGAPPASGPVAGQPPGALASVAVTPAPAMAAVTPAPAMAAVTPAPAIVAPPVQPLLASPVAPLGVARPAALSPLQSTMVVVAIAAAVVLGGAWLIGRESSPGAELEAAASASATGRAAQAAASSAAPAAVTAASLGAAPTAPSVVAPQAAVSVPTEIPAGRGVLIVTSPDTARVYVTGKFVGHTNEPIAVGCGRFFVRIGVMAAPTDRTPTWIAPGESIAIPCHVVTSVRMFAH